MRSTNTNKEQENILSSFNDCSDYNVFPLDELWEEEVANPYEEDARHKSPKHLKCDGNLL